MARPTTQRLGRPRCAPDVPAQWQADSDRVHAALALLLLDAGLLRDADCRRRGDWLESTCTRALRRWAQAQCADLRVFTPAWAFRIARHAPYESPSVNAPLALQVEWYATQPRYLIVGPAITHLEKQHRRLGITVMQAIHQHSFGSIPVFAFDDQLDIARFTFWGGEENLDDYLQSYELDDDDAAHARESCLDRDDIVKHTPEWVFSSRYGKPLTTPALTRIATRSPDLFCRQMARAVLALPAIPPGNPWLEDAQDNGGEFVGFGAVLRWSEDDHTLTLLEALWDQAHQGGEGFERLGSYSQALDDSGVLTQWLTEQATWLSHVRLMDGMIAALIDFKESAAGS